MKQFDLISIGSGITALSYIMQFLKKHPEKKVLILEKHRLIGGYATQFTRPRQNASFDVSLHKLTGMGDDGNLRKIIKDFGLFDTLNWVFPEMIFDVRFNNQHLTLSHNIKQVIDTLTEKFPNQEQAIKCFFNDVATYGYDAYMQFRILSGDYEPDLKRLRFAHANLKEISVKDKMDQYFSNDHLKEIIAIPCIYVGSYPEQVSYLYFLHVWYAVVYAKTAYLKGGSSSLAEAFVKQIKKLGGEFVTREDVQEILTDPDNDNQALAVKTKKGHIYYAEKFIVNTSPKYAMNFFQENIQQKKTYNFIESASSTTTLYIVLDKPPEELGLTCDETILLANNPEQAIFARKKARENLTDSDLNEQAFWQDSSIEVTNYHKLDPESGPVVVINALDLIHHWPERKTTEYKEKKLKAQNMLLNRLIAEFPLIKGHVKYLELATPRTYIRYTNNTDGSGYGALVTGKNPKPNRNLLKNVQLMSHWVSGGGYEATIGYGSLMGSQA